MALKNSNTVALERRYDLSTLFCMIGRHGPAVAMAIVATLSVLAAFVIYRTVRGQRRKATAAADKDILGAEKDAAVGPPGALPNQEESHNPVESTDGDGQSPAPHGETEEDAHLIQGQNLETNDECRAATAVDVSRAAVEEEPRSSSPPAPRHLQGLMSQGNDLDYNRTPRDDVVETAAASRCHQCESNTVNESVKPKINAENAGSEFTQCDMDTVQDETVQDETAKDETAKDETAKDETARINAENAGEFTQCDMDICEDETAKDETVQDDTAKDETAKDETARINAENAGEFTQCDMDKCEDETLQDETLQDETAKDETAKDETVQDDTAKDETLQDEGVPDAEVRDWDRDSRQREEELHNSESGREEDLEMACKAEDQEVAAVCQDEDAPTDGWVPSEKTKPEEEDFQSAINEPLTCTPRVDKDDGLQCERTAEDKETFQSAVLETLCHFPQVKGDANEEEDEEGDWHREYIDNGNYDQDLLLERKCVEYQVIPQQAEIWTPLAEQLMSLPLTELPSFYEQQLNEEQKECENVAENVTLPLWDGAKVDRDGEVVEGDGEVVEGDGEVVKGDCEVAEVDRDREVVDGEVAEGDGEVAEVDGEVAGHVVDGDLHSETVRVSDPQGATCDPRLPSFCQRPQNEATNDEECALPSVADQLKETSVTCDDNDCIATREIHEDGDRSSLVLLPSANQPHASEPENESNDGNGKDCVPAIVIHEDWDIPSVMRSSYQQPNQSEQKEDNGLDADDVTVPVLDEENGLPVHGPHLPSLSQEELSGKKDDNEGDDVMVLDEDGELPMHLPSFGQEPQSPQQVDSNVSSPTVDEDSGISSTIFSLHLQSAPQNQDVDDDDEDISAPITDEDWDLALDPHLPSVNQQQQQHGQDTIDMSVTVVNDDDDHPSMVFGSLPSSCHQPHSYRSDEVTEQLGANDDMFGQAVEDRYYRAFDEFGEQIAAGVTSYTDELNSRTETKDTAKLLEAKKKKKEGGSIDEKGRTQAKEDEEEDHEKTEINIMEATMDNNEWMTDGNNRVLPWMSFSLKSYAQNLTKPDQLPTGEPQRSSASTTAATDAGSSNEAKDATAISLSDEDAENNKKVAAVQPMPQSVNVTFCVHYLTHSPGQTVAVAGNQQELGNWRDFVPLERAKDGYWASVINLPAESQVEWKFVLVDEGKIRRWEECENRCLDTGHGDDVHVRKWWGFL